MSGTIVMVIHTQIAKILITVHVSMIPLISDLYCCLRKLQNLFWSYWKNGTCRECKKLNTRLFNCWKNVLKCLLKKTSKIQTLKQKWVLLRYKQDNVILQANAKNINYILLYIHSNKGFGLFVNSLHNYWFPWR